MDNNNSCLDININKFEKEKFFETDTRLFYDLMTLKVREILLVSSTYDAFIVEEEGLISELVIWEYRHLLLSSPPRVTHVTSGKDAIEKAKTFGLQSVEIYISGVGSGRESAVRALQPLGISVSRIKDTTPVPHNGCRPKKARRV